MFSPPQKTNQNNSQPKANTSSPALLRHAGDITRSGSPAPSVLNQKVLRSEGQTQHANAQNNITTKMARTTLSIFLWNTSLIFKWAIQNTAKAGNFIATGLPKEDTEVRSSKKHRNITTDSEYC